jgi:hypothetical protein
MILSINGKAGSGKDTVGKIIQYLDCHTPSSNDVDHMKSFISNNDLKFVLDKSSKWQIKKYSDKLKDMVCILIGCTREQLEDQEFKSTPLGEEWNRWRLDSIHIPETLDSESYEQYDETSIHSSEESAIKKGEEIKSNIHIPREDRRYGMSADFSYEVTKEEVTPREILQKLGTDFGRDMIHPDVWLNALFSEYKLKIKTHPDFSSNGASDYRDYEKHLPKWIITDSRFPNDVEKVKSLEGITIRVNRPECEGRVDEHFSETALDNYIGFNYVIDNNGSIEDLIKKVREMLTKEGII